MRRFGLLGIVFLVLVIGALASQGRASITALWTNGVNAQQDLDAEVVVAPVSNGLGGYTYQVQSPSTNLAVGDILVGGINYNANNSVNYFTATGSYFNVLFMSQITSVTTLSSTSVSLNFAAPSVLNWDNVVTSLGLGSSADKTAAGSVAILFSNPNSGYTYGTSSDGKTLAQNFSTIYGGPGVTNLGELGFNGATSGTGSGAVTLPNSTGEAWNAVGPPNLSGAGMVNVGNSLTGTNITLALDPTNGYISTLPLAKQFIPSTGGFADFGASETLAGIGGANPNVQVTSGGNASFVLVPEPAGLVVMGGLFGLWAIGRASYRRMHRA